MNATWQAVLPFGALGLLGALHCAGMCGGFAAIVVGARASVPESIARSLAYVLGKACTYAILGLLAAVAGHWLAHRGATLLDSGPDARAEALLLLRKGCAWLAGATLIAFGLGALGLRPPARMAARFERARTLAAARSLFAAVAALPGLARPLGIGLVTGLLPCGLSWSAFALAAGSGPVVGPLGAFVFGLSTAPALLAAGLGWRGLAARRRRLAARLAGPLLVLFGAYTALRGGLPVPDAATRAALPPCCAEAAGDG